MIQANFTNHPEYLILIINQIRHRNFLGIKLNNSP